MTAPPTACGWSTRRSSSINLRDFLKERRLFIADGHHRYETALNYRDEMREATARKDGKQPFDYMMMFLTNAEQDGLVILPTHRALSRAFMTEVDLRGVEEMREYFEIRRTKWTCRSPPPRLQVVTTVGKLGEGAPRSPWCTRPARCTTLGSRRRSTRWR